MTIELDETFRCAVCGTESAHPVLMSSNMLESGDLDMRPGEMLRSTLHTEVQRCPECGFCHASVSDEVAGSVDVVRSGRYRDILEDESRPGLARWFLCKAMVDRETGQMADAAWAAIRAAWASDDADDRASADRARQQALALMVEASANDQTVAGDALSESALRVDLLRRTGRFREALETLEQTEPPEDNSSIAAVLHYQRQLVDRRNTEAHKVDDAIAAYPGEEDRAD